MKKLHTLSIISATLLSFGFLSCDDTVTTLGSSLIEDSSAVIIDSSFTCTGQSVRNNELPSRTSTQILGSLSAKEFGTFSSDFVAQFMPAMELQTDGVSAADIDSMKLFMVFNAGDFTGDSIVPMGFKVYPLTRELPSPIYSDFDPSDYYNPDDCWTPSNQIYTGNALYDDSISTSVATRYVGVTLPKTFAVKFFNEYVNKPQTFATPDAFVKFFPGLYVKNTFGSGRVINFTETRINMFYHRHATVTVDDVERDTIYNMSSAYMAVTPEVISNNIINMQLSSTLQTKVDNGETLLVAPAGYDVEMRFPAPEIISSYRQSGSDMSVINTLTLSIPVETLDNDYNINPPANILLILSKDKNTFYEQNKITDDITSFLAAYNETSKSYEFTELRQFIIDLLNKDTLAVEDYSFTITPVNVKTETSSSSYYSTGTSYVSEITPYVSGPTMCKLLLNEAKIKFTYSKESTNN